MTKEETSKILALYSIAGVRFDGSKNDILNMWSECLEDLEYQFVAQATKSIIKTETELFANGLIAKTRQKAKLYKDLFEIERKQLEGKNDIRRIGRNN